MASIPADHSTLDRPGSEPVVRADLRNLAIIAHVDHGKTTLVDGMLRQSHTFRDNQNVPDRVLDSNDLERERGITILAKNTAITIWDAVDELEVTLNIVDTPGHADFGGEVERVLNMVDGVLLLVDAAEGPMPQTRYVLKKALEMGRRAIVVINKIDRRGADPNRALNETFDLFIELGATDEQADFPVVYTNALEGHAGLTPDAGADLMPLFRAILDDIPAPVVDPDAPLQVLVTTLGYDDYQGVTAVGRLFAGRLTEGQPVVRITREGEMIMDRAPYLHKHQGLEKVRVQSAEAGDIVVIAGLQNVSIGETLADPEYPVALPPIQVEEPTVRMTFGVNTSPFAGNDGRWGTSRRLRERLYDEVRHNPALRVTDTNSADSFEVCGRGELHLAVLIETMRREGYEFQVSRPQVITHRGANGELLEPYEEVHIETTAATLGPVMEMMGNRRGQMLDMAEAMDGMRLTFMVPTRGLLGFRYQFLTATRGMGIMHSLFHSFRPVAGEIAARQNGSLVASDPGTTSSFGLENAEKRGTLFVTPGVEVYEGMVVGENQRGVELAVNVCKRKALTNMRQSIRDVDERLTTPRLMSLDEAIEYLADDDLLEVTPLAYRIRKRILNTHERGKSIKRTKQAQEG